MFSYDGSASSTGFGGVRFQSWAIISWFRDPKV